MTRAPREMGCKGMPFTSITTKVIARTSGIRVATTRPERQPRETKVTTRTMATAFTSARGTWLTLSSTTHGWSATLCISVPMAGRLVMLTRLPMGAPGVTGTRCTARVPGVMVQTRGAVSVPAMAVAMAVAVAVAGRVITAAASPARSAVTRAPKRKPGPEGHSGGRGCGGCGCLGRPPAWILAQGGGQGPGGGQAARQGEGAAGGQNGQEVGGDIKDGFAPRAQGEGQDLCACGDDGASLNRDGQDHAFGRGGQGGEACGILGAFAIGGGGLGLGSGGGGVIGALGGVQR